MDLKIAVRDGIYAVPLAFITRLRLK